MKKKIIISIFLTILMTGCSANYKIKISNGIVEETFSTIENNFNNAKIKDESGRSFVDYSKVYGNDYDLYTSFYNLYADEGCAYNCEIYDKKFINNEKEIGFELTHKFTLEEYGDSSIANELLQGFNTNFDGRYFTISSGNNWNHFDSYNSLDDIKIEIETDYFVKETNGQKNGNNYVWNINKNNMNKSIYITFDTNKEIDKVIDNAKGTNSFFTLIVLILIALLLFVFLYLRKNKNQKSA